jgi:uncharacterized protein YlaI
MKVKCTKCGRIVQRTKDAIQRAAQKAGKSTEDYIKTYLCSKCRKK